MIKKPAPLEKGLSHIVTVGTTPAGVTEDVVEALIRDLAPSEPARAVVLATEDSTANADRLLKALSLRGAKGRTRILQSAQSLEEAYMATSDEISRLLGAGVAPEEIILHYTAGTKVMSAGAVLAAVNSGVSSLRYIYSRGRKEDSTPVTTPTRSVLGDKEIRLAETLAIEMRFRSASEVLDRLDDTLLTDEQRQARDLLQQIAPAYEDWDRFRVGEFLERYRPIEAALRHNTRLRPFLLTKAHTTALERIAAAACQDTLFPDELLIDLMNNAIRRLAERRPDDTLIRLHRAAELYAQSILQAEFGIRTDDVEIRRVPPRSRMSFESERHLYDTKIKLGLRKSYELLEVLGHPIGQAYREHAPFQQALDKRRDLVLAHGTRPATLGLAMTFLHEVEDLLRPRIPDIEKRAAAQQFPWIDNRAILKAIDARQTAASAKAKAEKKPRPRYRGKRKKGG